MENLLAVIGIAIFFGVSAAVAGTNRGGNGLGWFCAGFFLGPIGFALSFSEGKRCFYCQNKIDKKATICPCCGGKIN